jgi:hypothetical protein
MELMKCPFDRFESEDSFCIYARSECCEDIEVCPANSDSWCLTQIESKDRRIAALERELELVKDALDRECQAWADERTEATIERIEARMTAAVENSRTSAAKEESDA